jgi:hypothetical protein
MNILFMWYGEGATEAQRLAWEGFRNAELMKDTEFLELDNRKEIEATHEHLTKDGWELQSVGSGSLARLSSYVKSEGR